MVPSPGRACPSGTRRPGGANIGAMGAVFGTVLGDTERDLENAAPMAYPVAGCGWTSPLLWAWGRVAATIERGSWDVVPRAGGARCVLDPALRFMGTGWLPAVGMSTAFGSPAPPPSLPHASPSAMQAGGPDPARWPDGFAAGTRGGVLLDPRVQELKDESESGTVSARTPGKAGHAGTVRCALVLGELGKPEDSDESRSSPWWTGDGGE